MPQQLVIKHTTFHLNTKHNFSLENNKKIPHILTIEISITNIHQPYRRQSIIHQFIIPQP